MSGEDSKSKPVGRIILDVSRRYFCIHRLDASGKVIDEDYFRFPYDLKLIEVKEEVEHAYGIMFDYANEFINGVTGDGGEDDNE